MGLFFCLGEACFVVSAFGMLTAHFFVYHTIGTIVGLAFMLSGICMALMTRKERLSRWILTAIVILMVAGGVFIWAFKIDVSEVLYQWEKHERQLGRPPWNVSTSNTHIDPKVNLQKLAPETQ